MEVKEDVKTVLINYSCDNCSANELFYTGKALLSSPPQYVHWCKDCNKEVTLNRIYPYIEYNT